jgi:hypothetical protein
MPNDLWEQVGQTKVNLDVDREPFWVAMRELSRQTGLELTDVDGKMQITQSGAGSRITSKQATVAGAFLIVPRQASLTRTINYEADDPKVEEDFSLELSAFPEPKLKVLKLQQGLKLEQAVDDKGASLLPEAPKDGLPIEDIDVSGSGSGDGSYVLLVQLKRPKQPGTRLARLRGTVGFRVQVESQTIEVRDLKTMKDASRIVNGVRVVFNDLKKDQDQYQLRVTVFTDPNNPAVWEELQPAMTQRIRLYDARGQALETHGLAIPAEATTRWR